MRKFLLATAMGLSLTGGAHAGDWFQNMTDRMVEQNSPARLTAIAKCIEMDNRRRALNISGRTTPQQEADYRTAYEICIIQAQNIR
jgi:hypothetical protein